MFEHVGINSLTAHRTHEEIINMPIAYSLTFTLNLKKNHLLAGPQYKGMLKQLEGFIITGSHLWTKFMMTPELTKECNIHFHCYYNPTTCHDEDQVHTLIKLMYDFRGYVGQNYKLKKIDSVTPELSKYPFKDFERTLRVAALPKCKFNPRHIIYNKEAPTLFTPQHNEKVTKTITDFINYINFQKNI